MALTDRFVTTPGDDSTRDELGAARRAPDKQRAAVARTLATIRRLSDQTHPNPFDFQRY
jgi:hypothetical protein